MKAIWKDKGFRVKGENKAEVDSLRAFFKVLYETRSMRVELESGNGKDLCTFLDLPYSTTDQEGTDA